ncbi:MAG: hypothetical protein ACREXR_04035, partial [Gammaproteobacteria bacterium]
MRTKPCQTEPVVSSEACEVWVCSDCGIIHFHMGPISLRVKPEHFAAIAATLQEAVFELRRREEGFDAQPALTRSSLNH